MERFKKEVDEFKDEAVYQYADRFINLANELAQSDNSGAVGVGFRFAAARYCAYEASILTDNLAAERSKHLQMFLDAFKEMLDMNFDDYIKIQMQK